MVEKRTSIGLYQSTKDRLKAHKSTPTESYEVTVLRLLNFIDNSDYKGD